MKIPQINITASYTLKSIQPQALLTNIDDITTLEVTNNFSDGRQITLIRQNPLIYLEELNTELLTQNYDIEVFEV